MPTPPPSPPPPSPSLAKVIHLRPPPNGPRQVPSSTATRQVLTPQSTQAKRSGRHNAARNDLCYLPPKEREQRRIVAWVSFAAMVLFLGFAAYGAWKERMVAPLPTGSDLLLDLAMKHWPEAYWLGVAHNLVLAGVAGMFLVSVTTGHVDLPAPRRGTIVWRRQVRFAYPELCLGILLFAAGLYLQRRGHTVLAAVPESLASAMLLHALAQIFVPSARMFLTLDLDEEGGGLQAVLIIGGGVYGMRHGLMVIRRSTFINARRASSLPERLFGLSSLYVDHKDGYGRPVTTRVGWFAATPQVQEVEVKLDLEFRLGLSEKSLDLPVGHPLRKLPRNS